MLLAHDGMPLARNTYVWVVSRICTTLQHTATEVVREGSMQHSATQCNTVQHTAPGNHQVEGSGVSVLLCFIKPNTEDSSRLRGNKPRNTHFYNLESPTYHFAPSHLGEPGVAGSCPFAFTTSLSALTPVTSSSNGPSDYFVTWLIRTGDMTNSYVWHNQFIRMEWLIHTCGMNHSHLWHDSFIRVTWLLHMCDMTHSYVWHDSFTRVTWLIHTCDMTHTYVCHDPFVCATWLIRTCDMTYSYVWHDSFICMTWLIHTCDMTHSYVWHDSLIRVSWLIHMCDMTPAAHLLS